MIAPRKPKLSDLVPKVKFKAGDRVLAVVGDVLSTQQYAQLAQSICNYAKEEVRVIIVNCREWRVVRYRGMLAESLVDTRGFKNKIDSGVLNLNCSVVDIQPNDSIVAICHHYLDSIMKKRCYNWFRQWIGKDADFRIVLGNGE